jgi:hypothetical protein
MVEVIIDNGPKMDPERQFLDGSHALRNRFNSVSMKDETIFE